jgi:hypothetical protein
MNRTRALTAASAIGAVVIAAFFLASSRAYSPGPLSAGHATFEGQCASCHQPWHPLGNSGCIDCHGNYVPTNPHRSAKLTGENPDLVAGRVIRVFLDPGSRAGTVSCLSCHTDHRGRRPNLASTAATNCTFCHPHATIDEPTPHTRRELQRPTGSRPAFRSAFVHAKELQFLKQRDRSIRRLPCESCHRLANTGPDQPEAFVILRSGLKMAGESAAPAAANSAPQSSTPAPPNSVPPDVDEYTKIWESVPATTTQIPLFTSVNHLNTLFTHSTAHLGYKCSSCHSEI